LIAPFLKFQFDYFDRYLLEYHFEFAPSQYLFILFLKKTPTI